MQCGGFPRRDGPSRPLPPGAQNGCFRRLLPPKRPSVLTRLDPGTNKCSEYSKAKVSTLHGERALASAGNRGGRSSEELEEAGAKLELPKTLKSSIPRDLVVPFLLSVIPFASWRRVAGYSPCHTFRGRIGPDYCHPMVWCTAEECTTAQLRARHHQAAVEFQ